ncbi:MAG TPA: MlaD family protein [Myxococcota bacterium]|nr:MlaD family protein [Myxococcota bacterium]
MQDRNRTSLIVGTFALAALGALGLAILSLSSQEGVFGRRYHLVGYYDNVQGLIPNAPVWLAGTRVGRVKAVNFSTRPDGHPAVKVELLVDQGVQQRIRADSSASIGTIGLLGDRYIEISLGSESEPVLTDGAEIRVANPANLARVIDTGTEALDNIATLAKNLNKVVVGFQGKKGDEGLTGAIASVADIASEIQHGNGMLHSLIYEEHKGGGLASLEKSLVTFEGILDEVATGNGLLHSLVYEPLTEQDVVLEVLDAGSRLNSILAKIDTGEGTLGLLLNDPTVYEDLKELLGGAQRSALVRTLIQVTGREKTVDQ